MKKIISLLVSLFTFSSLLAQEKASVSSSTITNTYTTAKKKKSSKPSINKTKKKTIVTKQETNATTQESIEAAESQTLSPKQHPNALPIGPMYKEGKQAMLDFITTNLKVPNELKKNAVTMIVTVTFKVATDGTLTEIKARKADTYGCDVEAERIVKLMPNWVAGRVGRTFVEMPMAIDIEFK